MNERTPRELVKSVQQSTPAARADLEQWFRSSVERLVARSIPRRPLSRLAARAFSWRGLSRRREILVDRTLRWIEIYLRCEDASTFENMSHDVFRAHVLIAASRMLAPSSPAAGNATAMLWRRRRKAASEMKPAGAYGILSYSLPLEYVGGDWSEADVDAGGNLWVVVSDVTSHGDIAYVIARGLAELWRTRAIADRRRQGCPPCEILDALSKELEQVLPDDVFVEAVLARYAPGGGAIASAAGNCRLILRRAGNGEIDVRILGGLLLGIGSGERDQAEFLLRAEDEVALASDGLFEQWVGDCRQGRLEKSLAARVERHLSAGMVLHESLLMVLNDALRTCHQHDDITLVTVRFGGDSSVAQGGGHVAL